MTQPPAPKTHGQFTARYPSLAKAWEEIAEAGRQGPLDEKTQRLVKLAVAIGAMREGAVHAAYVRPGQWALNQRRLNRWLPSAQVRWACRPRLRVTRG